MKYLNCRVCEMTLNAAAEQGEHWWCSKCQTTTEVQAAPEPTPITQVDPAWQKAMDDLADERDDLLTILNNITGLWDLEAPLEEIENAMLHAKHTVKALHKKDE
jgi:hypothetical protein